MEALFKDKNIKFYTIVNIPDYDHRDFARTIWYTFRLTPRMLEKYPDVKLASEYLKENKKYKLTEGDKQIFETLEDAFITEGVKSFILMIENMCDGNCKGVEFKLEDKFFINYFDMSARLGKKFYSSIIEDFQAEDVYDTYVKPDYYMMYGFY